jgi:hypothetical protein
MRIEPHHLKKRLAKLLLVKEQKVYAVKDVSNIHGSGYRV